MSDYLSADALIDIFTRLPIKTLLQIRCVCKSWYALIDSPNFITAQINRTIAHTTTPLLLLRYHSVYDDIGDEAHYSVHRDDETFVQCKSLECAFDYSPVSCFRIVGSCNGLICLSDNDGYTDNIILWNPTIYKSLTLHIASDSDEGVLGFGFDSRTNDYKVVRIVPPEVDVYELSTGLWRRSIGSAAAPPYHMNLCDWSQVFVNGASHWIAFERGVEGNRYLILSFDMGSEIFKEMMLPGSVATGRTLNMSIALFGEYLSLFHYDDAFYSTSNSCCIWVMKEYGVVSSWTKLFTVDPIGRINKVLGFRKMGEVLVEKIKGKLLSYDPKSKKEVDTGIRGSQFSFHLDTYMESLVLLGRKK